MNDAAVNLLPWLNLLLVPVFALVLSVERRLTRLEALREADQEQRSRDRRAYNHGAAQ